MNINPKAKRILCYGDSNTWGAHPNNDLRYATNVRWTGLLQAKLGEDFEIIEEGLCGRTTVIDDTKASGRNGETYLKPCLESHNPIDLVILMLGTNDLKERFDMSAETIAANNEKLILMIKKFGKNKDNVSPNILLISPILVNEHIKNPTDGIKGGEEKSKQFAKYFKQIADRQQCAFVDLAQYVSPSEEDGCHLEAEAHRKIAIVIEEKIKTIINKL